MEIMIHSRLRKYINESGEKQRLITHLKKLTDESYHSGSGGDIKKLKVSRHDMYQMRVGDYFFSFILYNMYIALIKN